MTNEVNQIKKNIIDQESGIKEINNKMDKILLLAKIINQSGSINISNNFYNQYEDANENLENLNNPFYRIAIDPQNNNSSNNNKNRISESSDSEEETIDKKTKNSGQYKERYPLYYYNIINENEYKYTCKNKNSKLKYNFYCSDTHCKATGIYFKNSENFEPSLEEYIDYNEHSYIIDKYIKNKYDNNDFYENDFSEI